MTGLEKLIEAVEVGDLASLNNVLGRMFAPPDEWPWDWISQINSAFKGSFDAAKALHEALLPGMKWIITDSVLRKHDAEVGAEGVWFSASAETPARAWLLAVLRAYAAQQEPTP